MLPSLFEPGLIRRRTCCSSTSFCDLQPHTGFVPFDLAAAILQRLDSIVFLIGHGGEIVYANDRAKRWCSPLLDVPDVLFHSVWQEPRDQVEARLRRIAGSPAWQPFVLNYRAGGATGSRASLRGRAMLTGRLPNGHRLHILITQEPGASQPIAVRGATCSCGQG